LETGTTICEANAAPFYFIFFNSFVKTPSIMTIFGTHIYLGKFLITRVFNILYIIRDVEPA